MEELKKLFSNLDEKLEQIKKNLSEQYAGINEGHAMPSALDSVMVDVFGTQTPIQHIATISREGVTSLVVSPFDVNQTKNIETAIVNADLGLSAASFGSGVRVTFPPMTEENREGLKKLAKQKLEDAKNTMKPNREKVINEMKKLEKDGMSKDDHASAKKDLQKTVDDFVSDLSQMYDKKTKALSL